MSPRKENHRRENDSSPRHKRRAMPLPSDGENRFLLLATSLSYYRSMSLLHQWHLCQLSFFTSSGKDGPLNTPASDALLRPWRCHQRQPLSRSTQETMDLFMLLLSKREPESTRDPLQRLLYTPTVKTWISSFLSLSFIVVSLI